MIRAQSEPTFAGFRATARDLLRREIPPEEVLWDDVGTGQGSLLGEPLETATTAGLGGTDSTVHRVPRAFLQVAELASYHRYPARFALLYRILFRLTHGEPHLLEIGSDEDVVRLRAMVQAVRRDEHKMHAFVRFRRAELPSGERFVAYYTPDHLILPLAAPFFARRFASQSWSILTPDGSAHWEARGGGLGEEPTTDEPPGEIVFGPPAPQRDAPSDDELETLFRTYYEAIFNPARLNLTAMRTEMPQKRWAGLPETAGMVGLVMGARSAVQAMNEKPEGGAAAFVPASKSLATLEEAAKGCRGCPLYADATQTVFGEGARTSRLLVVGEQPGDQEDLAGRPFIGPAGKVFDEALERAGIDRAAVYVTNAVKHFKFEPRGKRRIHKKPAYQEVEACRPWLEAELAAVKPDIILCLGVTAAQSFLGRKFTLSRSRGQIMKTPWAKSFVVTYHPSALLRMPDEAERLRARELFAEDLQTIARLLAQPTPG